MAAVASHLQDYPPSIHHRSTYHEPSAALPILQKFLERTRKSPHLHPDSQLLTEGVRHGPKSGPSGGLQLHHLRRIEAGLRGEILEVESKEELRAQFGEEAVPLEAAPEWVASHDAGLGAGDDRRLDEVIEGRQKQVKQVPAEESDKARRKREKKERAEREKAQKRKAEADNDIEAREAAEEKPRKKIKKEHGSEDQPSKSTPNPVPEIQPQVKSKLSLATATEKKKKKSKKDKLKLEGEIDGETGLPVKQEDMQSQREYELSQVPIEGAVGDRDGAPVSRQDGAPPVIVKHDTEGHVKIPPKPKTEAEKAERKAAKQARRAEKKAKQSNAG